MHAYVEMQPLNVGETGCQNAWHNDNEICTGHVGNMLPSNFPFPPSPHLLNTLSDILIKCSLVQLNALQTDLCLIKMQNRHSQSSSQSLSQSVTQLVS